MAILQGVWKQHLWPRAVVGYGVKNFLPGPPNYVTRSPGYFQTLFQLLHGWLHNLRRAVLMVLSPNDEEEFEATF